MLFRAPITFNAARAAHVAKEILPTTLGSQALTALDTGLHRRAFTIARTQNARVLDEAFTVIENILKGEQSKTYGRLEVQNLIAELNGDGVRADLPSVKSMDRMLDTNLLSLRGYAQLVAGNEPAALEDFPAVELIRFEDRDKPRGSAGYPVGSPASIGWPDRWVRACQIAVDVTALAAFRKTARLMCLKNSPVRDRIADSGIFPDGLDQPYGPPAWGTGMDWIEVPREEAVEAGLITETQRAQPAEVPGFNESYEQDPGIANTEILDALLEELTGVVKLEDGVLKIV